MSHAAADHEPLDLLVVDTDSTTRTILGECLAPGLRFETVPDTRTAEELLQHGHVKILICSDELKGESGLMFLARTQDRWPMLQRILMVGDVGSDLLIHAMREVSVFHYLPKPLEAQAVRHLVDHSLRQHALLERLVKTERDLGEARMLNARLASGSESVHRFVKEAPKLVTVVTYLMLISTALAVIALSAIYWFKSAVGIDFMPSTHLRSLLPW